MTTVFSCLTSQPPYELYPQSASRTCHHLEQATSDPCCCPLSLLTVPLPWLLQPPLPLPSALHPGASACRVFARAGPSAWKAPPLPLTASPQPTLSPPLDHDSNVTFSTRVTSLPCSAQPSSAPPAPCVPGSRPGLADTCEDRTPSMPGMCSACLTCLPHPRPAFLDASSPASALPSLWLPAGPLQTLSWHQMPGLPRPHPALPWTLSLGPPDASQPCLHCLPLPKLSLWSHLSLHFNFPQSSGLAVFTHAPRSAGRSAEASITVCGGSWCQPRARALLPGWR